MALHLLIIQKLVVYVAVDHPKGVSQYGGTVAAPVAKSILTDCISILGIGKSENVHEKEYQWNEKKYYTVPNVVGMNKKDAIKELKNFVVTYTGSGDIVKEQSPGAGERIKGGSKVRILLGE